jgi:hypothetical protein
MTAYNNTWQMDANENGVLEINLFICEIEHPGDYKDYLLKISLLVYYTQCKGRCDNLKKIR